MSTPVDAASGGILRHDQFQAAIKSARERFSLIRKKHPDLKGYELIWEPQSDDLVDRELTPQTRASTRSGRQPTLAKTPLIPTAMETFAPGDRVVAINTDMSRPICGPTDSAPHVFRFPFGPLRLNVIYHVAAVDPSRDGNQALFLTGLRVTLDSREIGWNSSRFRKVDTLAGHVPKKRRRKQTVSTLSAASISLNL